MAAQQPVVVLGLAPLFEDRADAGRRLAAEVQRFSAADDPVVVGLARGGVVVAAEVARALGAELDVVAVRKIGHPWQPEYAIGAVELGHRPLITRRRGRLRGRSSCVRTYRRLGGNVPERVSAEQDDPGTGPPRGRTPMEVVLKGP